MHELTRLRVGGFELRIPPGVDVAAVGLYY
jgi:hypothetical protein